MHKSVTIVSTKLAADTKYKHTHSQHMKRQHEYHTFRTQHEFAKRCLRHNLHFQQYTSSGKRKIITHSLSGFANYTKHQYIQNY